MMDSYKILGVNCDSTLEEINKAYEEKLQQINNEVVNEKNAEAFKKVLKEAYDELTKERSNEDTLVMSKEEFNRFLEEEQEDYDDYYEDDYYYNEVDDKEKYKRKRRTSRSKGRRKKEKREPSRVREEERDYRREFDDNDIDLPWYISIPLKIAALPFIIILSIIVMIMDILNVALWTVTKILILGSVAVAAIYGYQVYSNMAIVRYEIFAGCAAVFILSIILPLVFKTMSKPLKVMNNKLKAFVF